MHGDGMAKCTSGHGNGMQTHEANIPLSIVRDCHIEGMRARGERPRAQLWLAGSVSSNCPPLCHDSITK